MNKQMTMKTRTGQPIQNPELNKSIFDNYLTNAQAPPEYNIHFHLSGFIFNRLP